MTEITLHPPLVVGRQILFSWSPELPLFMRSHYRVEYPEEFSLDVSPARLAEAYFPLCLALSALGGVTFRLPGEVDPETLENWRRAIAVAAPPLFRRQAQARFLTSPGGYGKDAPRERTALFYGGGAESLLVLARLLASGERPLLLSLGGENWPGSHPDDNPHKFRMDRAVSGAFGLELSHAITDFRSAFRFSEWDDLLKPGVSLMNAVLALPSFVSLALPLADKKGIRTLVNGNEATDYDEDYFCFSPKFTPHLEGVAHGIRYRSELGELMKEGVCRELYSSYPEVAAFQYSCWRNRRERWCAACSKCMQYYMLLKDNGVDPSVVGMDEAVVRKNLDRLIWAVATSPEGRVGEIWQRICALPRLRAVPELRHTLDAIRFRSALWHRFLGKAHAALTATKTALRPWRDLGVQAARATGGEPGLALEEMSLR